MKWLKRLALQVFGREGRAELISLGLADFKPGERTDERQAIGTPPLEPREHISHPHNAPGPFYSENEGCIACGAPNAAAPELMAWYEEPCGTNDYTHCIFRRQPETADEVERAIRAMDVSCVENLRYRGSDPAILERLRALGKGHLCDAVEH